MTLLVQIRFPECFNRCQDFAGLGDSIDSPVRQAAVGGLPENLNFYPGKPLMGNDDLQIRRLTDDGCICGIFIYHSFSSNAGIFLIGNQGQDHIAFQFDSRFYDCLHGHHQSGDAGLHVQGAATIDFALFVLGCEWIRFHVIRTDGIRMTI